MNQLFSIVFQKRSYPYRKALGYKKNDNLLIKQEPEDDKTDIVPKLEPPELVKYESLQDDHPGPLLTIDKSDPDTDTTCQKIEPFNGVTKRKSEESIRRKKLKKKRMIVPPETRSQDRARKTRSCRSLYSTRTLSNQDKGKGRKKSTTQKTEHWSSIFKQVTNKKGKQTLTSQNTVDPVPVEIISENKPQLKGRKLDKGPTFKNKRIFEEHLSGTFDGTESPCKAFKSEQSSSGPNFDAPKRRRGRPKKSNQTNYNPVTAKKKKIVEQNRQIR